MPGGQLRLVIGWPDKLLLVRHGESLGNVANARARQTRAEELDIDVNDPSVELSDLGQRQARALGRRLRDLDRDEQPTAVLVSPYVRAEQTADLVLAEAGLDGLRRCSDERLRDREQGVVDRLTGVGMRARMPTEAERRSYLGKFWYRPPGGESWADVAQRVRAVLHEMRLDYEGRRVLVVTHDVPIVLLRYILDPLRPDEAVALAGRIGNCGVTTYRRDGERMRLESFNDARRRGPAHGGDRA